MTLRHAKHLRTRPHWLRKCSLATGLIIIVYPIMVVMAATTSTTITSGNSLNVTCNGIQLSASRTSSTAFKLNCTGTIPTPTTQPPPTTTIPPSGNTGTLSSGPVYGLTIDDISNVSQVVATEQTLPVRPTTRVVFDWNSTSSYQPASYYASAIKSLDPVSNVMGELLDSSYEKGVSSSTFQTMVQSYIQTLGTSVNIWEIGNEVNGNWTGPYSTVATNLTNAYNAVAATGSHTALTLYSNEFAANNCGDGTSELTPVQYSQQYVSASVRDGLTYVFESYYPTQCGDTYPSSSQIASEMAALHALYPNALLGFGEVGLPNQASSSTDSTAETVMSWAYGLNPGLTYYVGGYFWWYGDEDLVPSTKPLYPFFVSALNAEKSALGG